MPTKIHWIHIFENKAKLGIMARPRGGDWLEDEIGHLKTSEVGTLVSLLERDEVHELMLAKEDQVCAAQNIQFICFPIRDRDIPANKKDVDTLVEKLAQLIEVGVNVVIHCRMGIGRSSIIAGAVLVKYKLTSKHILEHISLVRGLKVPDTEQQVLWLKSREVN